jgi:hypothetical protein
MHLRLLDPPLAVSRLDGDAPLPPWFVLNPPFSCAVRRDGELSLVCDAADVPDGVDCERPWRALEVAGPLDFSLTGILASLAAPLADAGVSIFAVATYDTDVLLVRAAQLDDALAALRAAGHEVGA